MNALIIGSGFGLYGYLPAISDVCKKIYLNQRYKKNFSNRTELKKYSNKIIWYFSQNKIISNIDYIIIAKRPQEQSKIVKKLLKKNYNFKHLFLEKPIDVNPKKSKNFLNYLTGKKIRYSFGFIFKYLLWYKFIKTKLTNKQNFEIIWEIDNKQKNNNKWKFNYIHGGGLVKFYGIHFIELFFSLNLKNIKKNIISENYWEIVVGDNKNNFISLIVRFADKNNFLLYHNKKQKIKTINPFLKKIINNKLDPRCAILKKYINKNLKNRKSTFKNDLKLVNFWDKIENINV
jgi:hypothetical protein